MALDELHARRLLTLMSVIEEALDRIEFLLETLERGKRSGDASQPEANELTNLRDAAGRIRGLLRSAGERFDIHPTHRDWRQQLQAELSTLWVVLENSRPRRMKGYGREFAAQDRTDWETLVHALLAEIEAMRQEITRDEAPAADPSRPGRFGN